MSLKIYIRLPWFQLPRWMFRICKDSGAANLRWPLSLIPHRTWATVKPMTQEERYR